jgi:hypothetical protein
MLINLMTADRKTLKTYAAANDDSVLFDDLRTPETESRGELALRSLVNAVELLWRRNQNRPVPFAAVDVIADAETRIVFEHP